MAEAPRSRTEPPRMNGEQPILKTGRATGPRSLPFSFCSRGPTFFTRAGAPPPARLLAAFAARNGSGLSLALTRPSTLLRTTLSLSKGRRRRFAALPSGASLGPRGLAVRLYRVRLDFPNRGDDVGGVRKILEHEVGASRAQVADAVAAGRNHDRARTSRRGAGDVEWRIADDDYAVGSIDARSAACNDSRDGFGQQRGAIWRGVTKRAAGKVSPEVEVLQLHACGRLVVAGQQREIHVVARQQRIEQRADAGHHPFARTGFLELAGEMTQVDVGGASEIGSVSCDAVFVSGVRENHGIRATRHRDAAECIGNREQLLKRESHRAGACAAGEHKRAVDVEENESGRDAQGFRLRRERFRRADLSPTVPLRS